MSTKRKPLDIAAFAEAAVPQPDAVRSATGRKRLSSEPSVSVAPSRVGKVQIQGYFPEDMRRRLKILAAQTGRTLEDLLGEALDDLLTKHHAR